MELIITIREPVTSKEEAQNLGDSIKGKLLSLNLKSYTAMLSDVIDEPTETEVT